MPFAVLDLDGVLADTRHRLHHIEGRHKDWDAFFAAASEDPAHPEGLAVVLELVARDLTLAYLSGRPERCRTATQSWLDRHDLPTGPVMLRGDDDRRPAPVVKLGYLKQLAEVDTIEVLVDDDPAVVRAVRAAWPSPVQSVLHARWEPRGRAVNAAQHRHGRT